MIYYDPKKYKGTYLILCGTGDGVECIVSSKRFDVKDSEWNAALDVVMAQYPQIKPDTIKNIFISEIDKGGNPSEWKKINKD